MQITQGVVQRFDLPAEGFHLLIGGGPLGSQLLDVLRPLLQHGGLTQLGVWILLQLRDERVQHIESVFDVVSPLLFGVDVPGPSLVVGSMLLLLVKFVANSAACGWTAAAAGFAKRGHHTHR